MKLIQENPYRIVGILSNTTAKEIQGRKVKITAFAKVGKQVSSEFDFPFLNSIEKDHNCIEKAFSAIQQSKEMLDNSLFWFLKTNSFDETAITYLINGDKNKAIEIWERVTLDKEVTSKNFSCFNNVGTLKLLGETQTEIKQGIQAKLKLIESSYFTNFVHNVAGEAFIIDNQKQLKHFVNVLIGQLKGKFSNREIITIFENCNDEIQKNLLEKFTEESTYKIESALEITKKKRNQSKIDAYKFGTQLYNDCKLEFEQLKSLLGVNDLKYKLIADNLAKEIMQCGIDYFNESQRNDSAENYLENAMRLNKLADSIAVGKLLKDRVKDSIETLENMKDREVNHAIATLRSIKMAYEKAISDIDIQVVNMRMTLSYNQTINYSKVEKMKAECLNWDKVVEVVSEEISKIDIEIIQRCPNQSKITDYKNLVDFLFDKLGPIQINQLKHICYWKDVRAAQAKSTAKKVGKTISTGTDGCYIATMAYGDFDHPQVMELRKFRDEFLRKTFFGRYFIKIYYMYSPYLVEKLKNKPKINELFRSSLDLLINTFKK
uniref:CFI-box-CTERM domain-containing protein n=1 Tax=Algoriphagus sp. TaxID=1872435 RepID=UPI004048D1EA